MIYDCFTFNDEMDLLEIRLNVLDSVVDKFVLVEATKTFLSKDKALHYKENKERFKQFNDKIIHIVVDEFPDDKNPWALENSQRNNIIKGLNDCNDDDIVIISDLDEIPRPEAIKEFSGNEITSIQMDVYNYFLNTICVDNNSWTKCKICRYRNIKEPMPRWQYTYSIFNIKKYNLGTTANKIRLSATKDVIWNGGWHFSFIGGIEEIQRKLASYTHQEYNNENYNTPEKIKGWLSRGEVIFGEGKLAKIERMEILPEYVVNNLDKYKHLIYWDEMETNYIKPKNHIKSYKLKSRFQMAKNFIYPIKAVRDTFRKVIGKE